MTGRVRITRDDGHELWIQPRDGGFSVTMLDDMSAPLHLSDTRVEVYDLGEADE